jgi:hypothetical protein
MLSMNAAIDCVGVVFLIVVYGFSLNISMTSSVRLAVPLKGVYGRVLIDATLHFILIDIP